MALSKERLLKVYRDMVMIRRFEEVIEEYAANGTIPGFVHLSHWPGSVSGRCGGRPEKNRL